MILAYQQIIEAHRKGEIMLDLFDENQVEAATYDLRVGNQAATTSGGKIIDVKEVGYVTLKAGDFAVITTLEEIRLDPRHAARFGLRSKYARKGLIATTGPQIDPGFRGRLIVGLTNLCRLPGALRHCRIRE